MGGVGWKRVVAIVEAEGVVLCWGMLKSTVSSFGAVMEKFQTAC